MNRTSSNETYFRNRRVKSTLTLAESLLHDPEKERRLAEQRCILCYYTIRISGQAFTAYKCGECSTEFMHHNTSVPKLCLECARKLNLCAECAAEIEFR
jgi:hypothetical protein